MSGLFKAVSERAYQFSEAFQHGTASLMKNFALAAKSILQTAGILPKGEEDNSMVQDQNRDDSRSVQNSLLELAGQGLQKG